MIACLETKNGYPAGRAAFAGLGFDPMTAAAFAPLVGDVFKNAGGGAANDAFFSYARGAATLDQQTRQKGIITAGLVVGGLLVGGLILWAVLK